MGLEAETAQAREQRAPRMAGSVLLIAGLLIGLAGTPAVVEGQQRAGPSRAESVLAEIDWERAITRRQGEFTVVWVPVPPEIAGALAGESRAAAKPFLLTVGVSMGLPSLVSGATLSDVTIATGGSYYYWFVVVNTGGTSRTLKVKSKLKGPGTGFKAGASLTFPGMTIALVRLQAKPIGKSGIYTYTVKVSGAGKTAWEKLCGGC